MSHKIIKNLQSNNISSAEPADGYVLTWVDGDGYWAPRQAPDTESVILGGDLSGASDNATVAKIRNTTINTSVSSVGASEDGYSLTWDNGSNSWRASPPPGGGFTAGGDLSGSSSSQTVNRLKGKDLNASLATVGVTQDGYVLTWDNDTSTWDVLPAPSGFAAGGDLSGTSSSQTVEKIKGTTITTAGGALTTGTVLRATGASASDWGAVDLGNSNAVTGTLPKTSQAAQDVGGDLSGTTASASVVKIRGVNVNATVPTDLQVLTYDNDDGYWKPADLPAPPTSLSVGGDLSGTTNSATVIKIQGVNVNSTAPSDNQVLTYSQPDGYWRAETPSTVSSLSMTGDVSGTTDSNTVDKIKGKNLDADLSTIGATQDGYVLTWTNGSSEWQAKPSAGGGFTAGGDLSGNSSSQTVIKINGTSVPSAPSANQMLVATSGTTSVWSQIYDGYIATNAAIDGYKISPNFGTQNITTTGALNVGSTTTTSINTSLFSLGGKFISSGISQGALSNSGEGIIYFNSSANRFYVSENGGSYVRFLTDGYTASGDLSGTYSAPTVAKIKGNLVATQSLGASQDGYVLTWDNGDGYWEAKPTAGTSFTAGGDLSGTSSSQTVERIKGKDLNSALSTVGSSQDGYALVWNNASSSWRAEPMSGLTGIYDAKLDGGCVGDGTTDDKAAIEASISAAASSNKTLWFPPGTYRSTGNITITSCIHIMGAGGVGIDASGNIASKSVIKFDQGYGLTMGTGCRGSKIEGIGVQQGATQEAGTKDGITILEKCTFRDVTVRFFGGHGFAIAGALGNEVTETMWYNCWVHNCNRGWSIETGNSSIFGGAAYDCRGPGIFIANVFGCTVAGTKLRGCNVGGIGFQMTGPVGDEDGQGQHLAIGVGVSGGNGTIYIGASSMWLGGASGAGFYASSKGLMLQEQDNCSPINVVNNEGAIDINSSVGVRGSTQIAYQWQSSDDANEWRQYYDETTNYERWITRYMGGSHEAISYSHLNHVQGAGKALFNGGYVIGSSANGRIHTLSTAAPTGASSRPTGNWWEGDVVWNRDPSGGTLLWVCTVDGNPGTWAAVSRNSFTAGGDLSGTISSQTVIKINGNSIATQSLGANHDGYVLTWDNGDGYWEAKPATGGSFTAGGDLSGSSSSQTVEKIKGTTITTAGGALPVGAVLRTTAVGTADWGTVDLADTDAVTGTLPVNRGGTGITSLGAGVATFLGTPSSANLASALTDETGTGEAVFSTTPTFKTSVKVNNPANTFAYTITPAAIAADRTLNLPLTTGTDTIVVESLAQTLTNKTLTSPVISTITNTGTLTLPTSTDTLVGRATTDTLTNKTLTSPVLTTPQINDTSADHQYIIAVNELVADRTVTLPLLTGNDEFTFNSHAQTLTNKTLTSPVISTITNTGTLTLPTSTDTLVGRATTDTLTNKTLTSPVITTPQINDTSATHQYVFAVSELAADRTVTLPVLISDDTFVFAAHAQTLTNKTLTSPTFSTINNGGTVTVQSGTYTLVGRTTTDTLTNKTLTSPVLTTPQINDTSADHQYVFAVNELAADRTVTLPLLTAGDTFVFEAHTQTLTNKTLTSPVINTPNFGANNLVTTGYVSAGSSPASAGNIRLPASGTVNANGALSLQTAGTSVITIDSSTQITLASTDTIEATATYGDFYTYLREVSTTDATVTSLFTWTITDEAVSLVDVAITAVKSDGTAGASYKRSMTFRRDGGTVASIGSVRDNATDENTAGWDVTIDNSTSTGRVRVTGEAATTIRWVATIRIQVATTT